MLKELHILLGVTGGIAAYKAVDLASKLTAAGAKVRTVMTESACRLVMPKSFEAVTGAAVYTSLWSGPEGHSSSHISLADWAKVVVVAPASADILGKVANGICDDLLSTTLCVCWATPTLMAPAMNTRMWENPAVQRNIRTLRGQGIHIVGPVAGRLACGTEGVGRMAEPQEIITAIEELAASNRPT
ncbi:MAG TPA: flavoprotein [Sedimentisphaerales bacterium]|nr:flavoprotein [Sedimentisphaerales bacterium]HQG47895.1 flavoprotein [Sedimentisphaerales bacterium]HQI27695.1 flavoprotein [Sedimentisphaerales bacterium]